MPAPTPTPARDPREPDHSKSGIFVLNRCWKCNDGQKPCARGGTHLCDFPRARND